MALVVRGITSLNEGGGDTASSKYYCTTKISILAKLGRNDFKLQLFLGEFFPFLLTFREILENLSGFLKTAGPCEGQWEDTGNTGLGSMTSSGSATAASTSTAAATALLAGELCRRATALRRTLYKMPGLIDQRQGFLEMIK